MFYRNVFKSFTVGILPTKSYLSKFNLFNAWKVGESSRFPYRVTSSTGVNHAGQEVLSSHAAESRDVTAHFPADVTPPRDEDEQALLYLSVDMWLFGVF